MTPQAMLSWPPGRRDSDGVWAPHWYQNVEQSTGSHLMNLGLSRSRRNMLRWPTACGHTTRGLQRAGYESARMLERQRDTGTTGRLNGG